MPKGLFGPLGLLLVNAGLAVAQPPLTAPGPHQVPASLAPPTVAAPPGTLPFTPTPAPATSDRCLAEGEDCGPKSRAWLSAEYLLWWTKQSPEPVPLATSRAPGAAAVPGVPPPGALGGSGTSVVLGGSPIDLGTRYGGRFTAGCWLDCERRLGVEAGYFLLPDRTVTRSTGTTGLRGSPVLGVPFFDVSGKLSGTGAPGEAVSSPAGPGDGSPSLAGTFTLATSSALRGAEANGVYTFDEGGSLRVEALAGFRWVQLREDLTFSTARGALPGGPAALLGAFSDTVDAFGTRNDFYGGQVGARAEYAWGKLTARAAAKVALGATHQVADVNGANVTNLFAIAATGPTVTVPGGAFAQPSNSGRHARDRFAVVPQVDLSAGYDVTNWARLTAGYSLLYLSDVARPGDQIDRDINPTRTGLSAAQRAAGVPLAPAAVGPAAPAFSFRGSSYWAQGLGIGLELRY
jgi:hypothetical protein